MRTYRVTLFNAAGRSCDCWVSASRESTACSKAVRRMESDTGERWYPSCALVES